MSQYKECDKLVKVSKESNKIGSFLDWLRSEKNFIICQYSENDDGDEELFPVGHNIEKLLAMYFKINMDKVEKERRQMLEELQK